MDIHKPNPIHGWRDLAKEVGIIVLGVLIALAAEQTVEGLNWAAHVREAEAQMRKELTEDDGPQAYLRLTQSPCIAAQLDAAEKALLAARDGAAALARPTLVTPTFFTWDTDAYRQGMAAGAFVHMSPQRAYAWSSPYTLMADLDAASVREHGDYAELSGLATAPPRPSEALVERLLTAVAHARADNALITQLSASSLRYLAEPSVALNANQKRLRVNAEPDRFPACRALREP